MLNTICLQQGADIIRVVLQTDDLASRRLLSHLPLDKDFLWTLVSYPLNSTQQFNAFTHFGCASSTANVSQVYSHCKVSPGIVAPVILQVSNTVPQILKCDETSPLATMGSGLYTDFHISEAIFMRSAFWALPLFCTAAVRHRTEWSYIVQWFLWHTGQGLTLYLPDNYKHYVNVSSSPVRLINFLSQNECSSTVDNCIISLLRRLLASNVITSQFLKTIANWMRDLKQVKYVFPTVKRQFGVNCSSPVTWSPVLTSAISEKRFDSVANVAYSMELQKQLCETHHAKHNWADFGVMVNLTHPWHQFRHLLLVITFNKPHYEVIPYLELLYRSVYPHILYCGPTPLDMNSIPALSGYRISFISYTEWPVHRSPGSMNYQCAVQAVRMNFNVKGFLFVSDDLLLLPVPLSRLSEDRVWFVPRSEIRIGDLDTVRECRLGMCDFHPHWDWWMTYKTATIETLEKMAQLARSSTLFYHCLTRLRQRNGIGRSQTRVNGAYSDIFHIPSRLAHQFADVAEVFADFGVFLEIAVPTVLQCLEPLENFQPLPGKDVQVTYHLYYMNCYCFYLSENFLICFVLFSV